MKSTRREAVTRLRSEFLGRNDDAMCPRASGRVEPDEIGGGRDDTPGRTLHWPPDLLKEGGRTPCSLPNARLKVVCPPPRAPLSSGLVGRVLRLRALTNPGS